MNNNFSKRDLIYALAYPKAGFSLRTKMVFIKALWLIYFALVSLVITFFVSDMSGEFLFMLGVYVFQLGAIIAFMNHCYNGFFSFVGSQRKLTKLAKESLDESEDFYLFTRMVSEHYYFRLKVDDKIFYDIYLYPEKYLPLFSKKELVEDDADLTSAIWLLYEDKLPKNFQM